MEGTPGEDDDEDDFWYPIGQPDIIRGHQLPGGPYAVDPVLLRDTYRGLAKVFIVPPPKDSLAGRSCFGSIPYRKKDGTSAYPFCRSCFERNDHRLKCEHQSDEERGMLVTLPTCEIFEACSKFGYKLAVVYEVSFRKVLHMYSMCNYFFRFCIFPTSATSFSRRTFRLGRKSSIKTAVGRKALAENDIFVG